MKKLLCIAALLFSVCYCIPGSAAAATTSQPNETDTSSSNFPPRDYIWNITGFYGRMTNSILNRVVRFNYSLADAKLYSVEGAYQLPADCWVRRLLKPLVSTVFVGANGTYQDDPNGSLYEFNPFVMLRWQHFPWDKYITTTFGFAEGVSWASRLPAREIRDTKKAENARKFLNLLLFEVTTALPSHPDWQVVYRVHHRSGVFGLYSPGITGSTAVQLGIRHQFN